MKTMTNSLDDVNLESESGINHIQFLIFFYHTQQWIWICCPSSNESKTTLILVNFLHRFRQLYISGLSILYLFANMLILILLVVLTCTKERYILNR